MDWMGPYRAPQRPLTSGQKAALEDARPAAERTASLLDAAPWSARDAVGAL